VGTKRRYITTFHPQIDRQTEFTNRTLRILLRGLIKPQSKAWNLILKHAKFTYNEAPRKATGYPIQGHL